MTSVLLIYPFFIPRRDRSVFRFPPLGLSSIAASLQKAGHDVHLIDCTFLERKEALKKALAVKADVVGVYCMVTMLEGHVLEGAVLGLPVCEFDRPQRKIGCRARP